MINLHDGRIEVNGVESPLIIEPQEDLTSGAAMSLIFRRAGVPHSFKGVEYKGSTWDLYAHEVDTLYMVEMQYFLKENLVAVFKEIGGMI